jgi:hypothetical protein
MAQDSSGPMWQCHYAIDVDVPVSYAWSYMTDVRNWNDPPAEFSLEGPFVDGTRGLTHTPGQPPIWWTIRDVERGRAYTIESGPFLDRAVLRFYWQFDPLSERSARMAQRVELSGENAAAYVDEIKTAFGANLEPGMRRIAQMIERARRTTGT